MITVSVCKEEDNKLSFYLTEIKENINIPLDDLKIIISISESIYSQLDLPLLKLGEWYKIELNTVYNQEDLGHKFSHWEIIKITNATIVWDKHTSTVPLKG